VATSDDVELRSFNHVTDGFIADDYHATWDRFRDQQRAFGVRPAASAFDLNPRPDQVTWYLLQYDDIHAAYRQPDLFSSANGAYTNPEHPRRPIDIDPPEHGHYRQLLTHLLGPAAVRQFEPMMRARCRELIDGFVDDGGCEYVSQFGYRFGPYIFMRILGLPVEEVDDFLKMAARRTWGKLSTTEEETRVAQAAVDEYLAATVADRERQPRDDLISELVRSDLAGRPIDHQGLIDICAGLFGAGLETVASASTWLFAHLATHPEHRAQLVADRAMVPAAVEELMRAYSIVVNERIVMRDVEFAGCPMRRGDRVALPITAANRDPREFPDPTTIDFGRTANRHLAFGAGPHRCVGAHLARLELNVALDEWHRRIPDYQVAADGVIEYHAGAIAALDKLPLMWPVGGES
jgi:cytochrome P450